MIVIVIIAVYLFLFTVDKIGGNLSLPDWFSMGTCAIIGSIMLIGTVALEMSLYYRWFE
jgi:hypothetical protein